MDTSLGGQNEMKKVINSHLTPALIDKLAKILSSNCCENYFNILVKFSQGQTFESRSTRYMASYVNLCRKAKKYSYLH